VHNADTLYADAGSHSSANRRKRRARQDFSFWDPLVFLSSIACVWERAYASFALLS
jgi:hypothetical protein